MDRLDAMTVFLAVVDAGSLSAAGRRRGMPLATVSRKLAELENHLGARLLARSTRRLERTDAGRAYEQACRRILDDVEGAERAAAGEYDTPRGELAITAHYRANGVELELPGGAMTVDVTATVANWRQSRRAVRSRGARSGSNSTPSMPRLTSTWRSRARVG